MSGRVHVSRPREAVVLLEIDNPPSNALGGEIRRQLEAELDAIETDLSVRAVVLTGRGKGFCSGDDLREAATRGEGAQASLGQFGRMLDKLEALRVPVIGAINGHAVGGGLELSLCCDIRLAAAEAKFLAAGVNVGLMASVHRLPRLVGTAAASMIILTGSPIDAAQAAAWGLVAAVHPSDQLLGAALDLAERIASRAPLSVEASKRMIRRAFDLAPEAARSAAGAELAVLSRSNDHREGLAAFAARREPVFTRS
ncbi:MAG TPA: enoyl-CoA hydratase/isomerase family protein [Caulobacteraceae bacterium]|jgi:enoyl-CoA hydratase|nr:enoyl-CoA hydratase/isomerase family protein [Caulobacteraceae bacterium]